jgi:hypothetical protein
MWLVRALGGLAWLSVLTMGLWAPHKPAPVVFMASGILGLVGVMLATWPRQ